jgi:hypothetical protein
MVNKIRRSLVDGEQHPAPLSFSPIRTSLVVLAARLRASIHDATPQDRTNKRREAERREAHPINGGILRMPQRARRSTLAFRRSTAALV